MSSKGTLKDRLHRAEPLIGSFLKTPAAQAAEIMGATRLDLVCIDAEHGPFDRGAIDLCLLALRSRQMPAIVRVPSSSHEHILSALDGGATGVMVPHVWNTAIAEEVVRAAHFGPGGRGYAGGPRSSDYGAMDVKTYLDEALKTTVVIVQIEDVAALDHVDAIAQVSGVDALFVGRMDLTVGLGASSPDAPDVLAAVARICAAGKANGRCVGMFVSDVAEAAHWRAMGASLFILSSDHRFIQTGANQLADRFHNP